MLAPNIHLGPNSTTPDAGRDRIRSLQSSDIPAVAELFQKTFRNPRLQAPSSLGSYLEEVFLRHPWESEGIHSLVFLDHCDRIKGFIGLLPLRLRHDGKLLRAAVLGSLMVENPTEDPLIGARLVRAALKGSQDISISESANPLSLRMWELAGGRSLPLYSMTWLRVFRPIAMPLALLARRPRPQRICSALVSPLDAMLHRFPANPFSSQALRPDYVDSESTFDEFIVAMPKLVSHYSVKPDWDEATLRWQLQHAAVKEKFGHLKCRLVRKGNRAVGGFLYYSRPGGFAFVLQILADPQHQAAVVASLLARAASDGCVAIRGRAQPELLDALIRQQAVLFNRSSTVVHSRHPELIESLRVGNALITGLAAEAWTRLIGGQFG